ncbi:MAG TPA: CehA/McbA family metallohydrolase, partial [Polyangiaceae bacterium]
MRRLALAAAAVLLLVVARASWSGGGVPAERVSASNLPKGLRVFAEVEDVSLENTEVTAVVRRRDGALVDFLRRRPTLPTADALGTLTELDGVWELLPVAVLPGGRALTPVAARVQHDHTGVLVTTTLEDEHHRVEARVRYEVFAMRPTARIAVTFRSSPEIPRDLALGLLVRWGNLSYFVEGNPAPLLSHSSPVAWAGRRGAGGDLLLRAVQPSRFVARFQSRPGFQGPLLALLERPVTPQTTLSAAYELSYESLPLLPQAEAPKGGLDVRVEDEHGRLLAAKATLLSEEEPQRAVFPLDGGLDGADRFAWTGNGSMALEPPAGRYEVLVSAGPERALARRRVELVAGRRLQWSVTLPRVVPTPGWIASDLHLHQAASVDADIAFEMRVISVAAEGVEFAVATDHYVVTDLAPTVRGLRSSGVLSQPLSTVAGSEVSTLWSRFGHFNVFPLPLDASIEYRDTTPARLFAAARRASPNGVLQVNHPRWEPRLGYFSHFDLHPETAQPQRQGFDPNFDTVEVYNGDDARDLAKVERNLAEFLRLLGGGRRYVATGSSDSHKLAFLDPGVPRTWIAHGGAPDDATDASAPVADVLRALKAGNAIVSSGPFLDVKIGETGPGQTLYAAGSRSTLRVRVFAPPWVSTSWLKVLEG